MKAGDRFRPAYLSIALAFTVMAGDVTSAQTPVRGVELTVRAATIVGTVVNADDKPIPGPRLRLRDVTIGRIVMTTVGCQNGDFRFAGVAHGLYLVECVDEVGTVRGVSQTFSVSGGETASTLVRLSSRRAWYQGFFSNAAAAAVSSAAGLGITAVGNGTQPASGRF
jgi:hypothetical protein